jgi:hypothetical protein
MIRIFRKTLKIALLAVLLISGFFLIRTAFKSAQVFLSTTQKVKANLLVVEGWLPQYAVEMASKEFLNNGYDLIITTGIKSLDLDYCTISSNGYLIFYPHLKSVTEKDTCNHTIELVAHSKQNGKYLAHFNIFVNDILIADFNADKRERKYGISWKRPLKDIDSIMIQFDNDLWDKDGDRNLYVKEIIIDKKIVIPYQLNSILITGPLDSKERISNDFDSNAELCRNRLIACGIDSNLVIAVPAKRVIFNRTLTSVMAFHNWLKSTNKRVTGINVLTLGVHSRRSWIIYKKIVGSPYEIGIISLPENVNNKYQKPKILSILYEIIGIMYYRIILNYIYI